MTGEREGALVSAGWSAAVVASSDPARYRRGKDYLRENAVMSLDVLPGQLIGVVQGSRAEAYEVVVAVRQIARDAGSIGRLVPSAADLDFECTCPDWDEPCKHAVAVAMAFGERLKIAPEELATLRFGSREAVTMPVEPARPVVEPPRRRRGHLSLVPTVTKTPEPVVDEARARAFLGQADAMPDDPPELDPLPVLAPKVGELDVAAVVADAVSWLAAAYPAQRTR